MAMMSVQIPVEDSLWNNAAKSFEERGTNIFDATKGFLKKAAETKQKTTSINFKYFSNSNLTFILSIFMLFSVYNYQA